MMLDTSTYYGQPNLMPPQFLLQGLFGQLHGHHAQPFGGLLGQHAQAFGGFQGQQGQPFGGFQGQQGHPFGGFQGQQGQPFGGFQQGQPFGGFPPQGLLGHLASQYGQQAIWPSGLAAQNPLALLSSLYGQHPIWPSIGGGFGQPMSPYQQLGQQGGGFQGGWPGQQFGGIAPQFGNQLSGFSPQFASPLSGIAPQLGALGQQYLMSALGRGIGMPQLAYSGC